MVKDNTANTVLWETLNCPLPNKTKLKRRVESNRYTARNDGLADNGSE